MAATALRREELLGLALALVAHAALIGWLVWQRAPAPIMLPERMTVTISDDVGLTAAAPQQAAPAPDAGPVQGEAPPPPEAKVVQPQPPAPAPQRPAQAVKPPPRPAPASPSHLAPPAAKPGASAFDSAFKSGIPQAKPGGTAASAAAPITGAVRNSLAGAVARQLKPKWHGPSGLDVDKLATTVEWDLNPDGSLAGAPRVISQTGLTDANRPQADRHKEQALKAVRTAAPFDLPTQYYAAWKHLRFTFDWKINQ
jgi:hypothetical protein